TARRTQDLARGGGRRLVALTVSRSGCRIGAGKDGQSWPHRERVDSMATDLHDLTIAELSRLIAARKLSPVDLVEALIQRIEQYDGQTRSFITRTFDRARQQARKAEA